METWGEEWPGKETSGFVNVKRGLVEEIGGICVNLEDMETFRGAIIFV